MLYEFLAPCFLSLSQALSQNTSRVSAGAMSGGLVVRAKSKQPGAGAGLDAAGLDAEHGKRRKVGGGTDADGAAAPSSSSSAASAHSYGDDADVTWRPPVGQRGDGRTAANAKFGY